MRLDEKQCKAMQSIESLEWRIVRPDGIGVSPRQKTCRVQNASSEGLAASKSCGKDWKGTRA